MKIQENTPVAMTSDIGKLVSAQIWQQGVFDPLAKPARGIERVVGSIVAKGVMTIVAGGGGTSKSTLLASISLGIASGNTLVGQKVLRPMRVLHLGLEDDQDMNERMFRAASQRHDVTTLCKTLCVLGEDLLRKALSWHKATLELITTERNSKKLIINDELSSRLYALIQGVEAEVVVIDPLAVLYGGVQMSNEAMNLLARHLKKMAQDLNVALLVASHTRKPAGYGRNQDQHDVKFGSELVDTARCVVNVMPLSEVQKTSWRSLIPESELADVRLAIVTKTNIGRGGERFYFRVSGEVVQCADGRSETVGVIEAWQKPTMVQEADPAIWPSIKKRLEQDFVFAAPSSRAEPKLASLIEEIGDKHHGKRVAEAMMKLGWVAISEEKNPNSSSKSKVQRAVVGPNAPDITAD